MSANKQMPMSGPAYMDTSITTPGLTADQPTGNGRDSLCMMERPRCAYNLPFLMLK